MAWSKGKTDTISIRPWRTTMVHTTWINRGPCLSFSERLPTPKIRCLRRKEIDVDVASILQEMLAVEPLWEGASHSLSQTSPLPSQSYGHCVRNYRTGNSSQCTTPIHISTSHHHSKHNPIFQSQTLPESAWTLGTGNIFSQYDYGSILDSSICPTSVRVSLSVTNMVLYVSVHHT